MRPLHVCRHEAAHAVVACHLGVKVDKVLIGDADFVDPDHGLISGYTLFRPEKKSAVAYAIALAAGSAADRIGKTAPLYAVDRQATLDAGFCPGDWPHFEALARNLLRGKCRTAWEKVTEALALTDLTGVQVRRMVKRYA